MIIPPLAAPQDFESRLLPPEGGEAVWLIFLKDQLLVSGDGKSLPVHHNFCLKRKLYIGSLKNRNYFAGEVESEAIFTNSSQGSGERGKARSKRSSPNDEPIAEAMGEEEDRFGKAAAGRTNDEFVKVAESETQAPLGWSWSDLRPLHATLAESEYAIAGRSMQLLHWDRAHTYCGSCGIMTIVRENERCRACTHCGQLAYPKIAPVIMALVRREDKILLARSPHFPGKFYSVLAGFVDPGETLEQCVIREIFEEVGVKVKNIRYFGSQPWPFSQSLMIAFTCDWHEGEIMIDAAEIDDAGWFDRSNLPQLPQPLSLARLLIESSMV